MGTGYLQRAFVLLTMYLVEWLRVLANGKNSVAESVKE